MSCAPVPKSTGQREPAAARGDILTARPDGSLEFVRDGLLVWDGDGSLLHVGPATREWSQVPVVAGQPGALLVAGFWDPHVHLPQLTIAGRYHEPLLEWLERRVFPEEARHGDPRVAASAAEAFFEALLAAGSVGAGILAAPFLVSAEKALQCAARRDLPVVCGPSLMDTGEPSELVQESEVWIEEQSGLMARYAPRAAVVPRFALSCTLELLAACGRLARTHRARVLGHVSENEDEVRAVLEHWKSESYVEIYEHAGLLGPRTLLAHGVHLTEVELRLLSFSRTRIAHAPTSNRALGSGRMPLERLRRHGVRWCLCSDVGAGPELSMLHVIDTFLEVHAERAATSPSEAFWAATWAAADALGFGEERGALTEGRQADFLVLDEGVGTRAPTDELVLALVEHARSGGWKAPFDAVFVGGSIRFERSRAEGIAPPRGN